MRVCDQTELVRQQLRASAMPCRMRLRLCRQHASLTFVTDRTRINSTTSVSSWLLEELLLLSLWETAHAYISPPYFVSEEIPRLTKLDEVFSPPPAARVHATINCYRCILGCIFHLFDRSDASVFFPVFPIDWVVYTFWFLISSICFEHH